MHISPKLTGCLVQTIPRPPREGTPVVKAFDGKGEGTLGREGEPRETMAALWGGGRGTSRERFQHAAPKANLEGTSPPAHADSEPPKSKRSSGNQAAPVSPATCLLLAPSACLSQANKIHHLQLHLLSLSHKSKEQEQKVMAEAISRQNLFSH